MTNILKGGYRNFFYSFIGLIGYNTWWENRRKACSDQKMDQNYKISQDARGILVDQFEMYSSPTSTDLVGEDVSKAIIVQGKEGWYG